jgi:hypothetical protein
MATTSNYSKIRFIGYAIPTTPANLVCLDAGSVAGTYLGNADTAADIAARVAVLQNAVQTAKAALPANEDPSSVLNVFLAPEFFFHGPQGPYVFNSTETDPGEEIVSQLQAAFVVPEYSNWLFVCGTAMTTCVADFKRIWDNPATVERNKTVRRLTEAWQTAIKAFGPMANDLQVMLNAFIAFGHACPLCEVRDRAPVVSSLPLNTFREEQSTTALTTEKYFESHEDFILYEAKGRPDVVTEQMVAYRWIDLSGGDLKRLRFDPYSIFRQNYGDENTPQYLDVGVEICLDHADGRLRKNIDHEPFPAPATGFHLHLVPSCGMSILLTSVAADANGFVFNCDGQYALNNTSGTAQQGDICGVNSIFVNYVNATQSEYGGHSQLARVQTPAVNGDPCASGAQNATFYTLDPSVVSVIPVTAVENLDQYFAGGPGAIHIYGLSTPYDLYQ